MDFSLATTFGVAGDASAWSNILSVIWRVVVVLLGVNMLVIVHEFGHFIVARMCGVRCDKFYIWFDAYGFKLFSFKKGDTEYGLGWLPLGGYVKMLGQEDNPGGIQEEIERAKLERQEKEKDLSAEEKEKRDEEIKTLENQLYSPDSYLAKNVFQRMAIISAGVIMNILFAIVCAALASVVGTPETSTKIGYVAPASPAWLAGLQPGDEIRAINDNTKPIFSSILVACMDGKELALEVARPGAEQTTTIHVAPRIEKGGLTPMIGVAPSPAVELADIKGSQPFDSFISLDAHRQMEEKLGALKGGEKLVAMNGVDVNAPADYLRLSKLFIDRPIEYEFVPTTAGRGGERIVNENAERISVVLEPNRAPDVGVRLTMGEIVAVIPGSVADKAGLKAREVDAEGNVVAQGDVILEVDNQPIIDPITFPYKIFSLSTKETQPRGNLVASSNRSIVLTVNREGERVDVPISLPAAAPYSGFAANKNVLACGTLGVAFEVRAIVSGVDGTTTVEGKPHGGKIAEIETTIACPGADAPESLQESYKALTGRKASSDAQGAQIPVLCKTDPDAADDENSAKILNWFTSTLPYLPNGTEVSIKVEALNGEPATIQSKVKRDGDAFLSDRGLVFAVDVVHQRADSFGEALAFGWNKTIESASQVFVFLKNVGKNVSAKALGGPGMIVGTAYQAAGRADGVFLLFLCLISANLAVVNFLPIPVLDGGHMVFLLYEAITRRKPNEKVQVILSYLGLALILTLMVWVIGLDIVRYCF